MILAAKWLYSTAAIAALMVGSVPLNAQNAGERLVPVNGVISSPGRYILRNDVRSLSSRAGIEIRSDGVALDLGGNQILGPGGNQGIGVMIQGVSGVSVTNGKLANNAFGVWVENSTNVSINNLQIRATDFAVSAPPPEVGVMIIQSRNIVVENNQLSRVGLGIFVRGSRSRGNRISHNTITAGDHGLIGICYNPAPDDPVGPSGDLVEDNLATGFNLGVQTNAATNNVFRHNTLFYKTTDFQFNDNANEESDNTTVMLP